MSGNCGTAALVFASSFCVSGTGGYLFGGELLLLRALYVQSDLQNQVGPTFAMSAPHFAA